MQSRNSEDVCVFHLLSAAIDFWALVTAGAVFPGAYFINEKEPTGNTEITSYVYNPDCSSLPNCTGLELPSHLCGLWFP